jgi:DNA polymerase-3 subunit epsilon
MYSIVDIETTGGDKNNSRITEIAIYRFDGEKIVDEFVTLVNPECHIPEFITRLTGINNEMVANAPRFYEIAKRIVEITRETTFVAHNAAFDYNFIKSEFESLGYVYELPSLCTVKLSRKLLQGHSSYSLGKLCADLGIRIEGRHRAGGDAYATVKLFEMLLLESNGVIDTDVSNKRRKKQSNHPVIKSDLIKDLPIKAGVYYLKDKNGDVIYIGKSKNIRAHAINHLSGNQTTKHQAMVEEIASIDFMLTGNELIALLKESEEIQLLQPKYNKVQKHKNLPISLFTYVDRNNYIRFILKKSGELNYPLTSFSTMEEAVQSLYKWIDDYGLCQKLCGLYEGNQGCFQYQLKQCKGACVGEETAAEYNKRAELLINKLELGYTNLVVLDKGRRADEFSVVYIENGVYHGYGFFDASESITSPQQFKEYIGKEENSRDAKLIIKQYLKNHKPYKVIEF